MFSSAPRVDPFNFAAAEPSLRFTPSDAYRQIYEANRHRVYAVAFWMTDNELAAEEVMLETFLRAFAYNALPTPEQIDQALIAELRQCVTIGMFTLRCAPATQLHAVRKNTLRVHLERALVQLPATEKLIFVLHDVEGYSHDRISRLLSITGSESQNGLHQARLRMRELLAN